MQDCIELRTLLAPREDVGGPLLTLEYHSQAQWVLKRGMDILLATALLVLLSPFLVLAAVLIAVIDRQAPFYRDLRVGMGRREFVCLKLRTLRTTPGLLEHHLARHPNEAERYQTSRKLRHDPRRTILGAFLRKFSFDELPQLINVLQGHMSLVGPRPVTSTELAARGGGTDFLLARPGLTGLWQINGRSDLHDGERSAYDSYYARGWTIALDLSIIARTPAAVLTARGAR